MKTDGQAPIVNGYYFGTPFVRRVANHNRRLAAGPHRTSGRVRLGLVFLTVPPRCNLRCPYCYTDSTDRGDAPGLTPNEIEEVLRAASQHGARSVVVAGDGEPFLSPTIWDIVEGASRKHMRCVVFTNGTELTDAAVERLARRPVSLILKVNSLRPSVQDELVGVPGAHAKVYAALELLLSRGFRAPRLALQSAIFKTNRNDLRDLFIFCREQSIVPYFETYVAMGRGAKREVRDWLEPSRKEVEDFFAELEGIDNSRFGICWERSCRRRVVACGACNKGQLAITVSSTGDVFRCVTESRKLGNIRESSIRDILASRDTLSALAEPACTGCASLSV